MIHITKYLVSIKLHFVCFLIGFLLFMNIFYFYYEHILFLLLHPDG